jgi:hypothetical protein
VIYPSKILYPRIYSMQPKMPNPQYYLICKQETRILVVLPKSSKVSQYYSRESLEAKKLLQNPQEQRMDARWKREQEMRWKSSSITLAQDMVKKRVRRGFYLYLERQTYLSWINAKCPPPSTRENP